MAHVRYPLLYQVNTRVWLTELSRTLGQRATLDDIPDDVLDRFAEQGFNWIWLLSVWQTGPLARAISRANCQWRREFSETLQDLNDDDIAGSGFAIQSYTVHRDLGGDEALARLRHRMKQRGLKLMLDFVPNHMGPDHAWVEQQPDYFLSASEADLHQAPQNYFRVNTKSGPRHFAYGRDPYFDGWPDTIQLNFGNPELQMAMIGELLRIAEQCDGVRCDMAMLVLPEVFERTWGIKLESFWSKAIGLVKRQHPNFLFLAEVYWDLEDKMHQEGFDFAYDKRLYDRLRGRAARHVREHISADLAYQNKLARFLENHDEPRAAATFAHEEHEAASILTFLWPGLRFFHQGQFEGSLKRISPHLARGPAHPVDDNLKCFYGRLLSVLRHLATRDETWQPIDCVSAWEGNESHHHFIACQWQGTDSDRLLVVVNYSPHQSQCFVRLPHDDLRHKTWRLRDAMSDAVYDRDGDDLVSRGLYLDMSKWGYHAFSFEKL